MASIKLAPWAFLLLFAAAQVTVEGLTAASKPRGPVVALAPIAGGTFVVSGTTFNGLIFNRPSNGGTNGVPPLTTLDPSATGVFYESIRFRVLTAGTYTIQSISGVPASWDNFCLLYSTNFNKLLPLNGLLASNDDNSAVGECFVKLNLAVADYIFITTAFRNGDYGTYSVYAAGPAPIRLQTTFYNTSTIDGGYIPQVTGSPPKAAFVYPVPFNSFRFTVSVAGTYSLLSTAFPNPEYNGICLLYNTAISTKAPLTGLIANNDNYQDTWHCYLPSVSLVTGVQYYFVITNYDTDPSTSSPVRNSISGPGVATPAVGSVSLSQTTSARITWSRSDIYGNPGDVATNTPYVTTQLCVSSAGTYSFRTTAGSPTWDTYLLLYYDNFNPFKYDNLQIGDDDTGPTAGVSAFDTALDKGVVYILVLTGNTDTAKGPATTVIKGPGTIFTGAAACP